jgi:acetyltransferase-like isoleucine patch superfamily enzyme
MQTIYLFSRFTLVRELKLLSSALLRFITDVLIFPKKSMYAAALRGLVLSVFMKGPFRVRFVMKGVVFDSLSRVFLDTDAQLREDVSVRGRLVMGKKAYVERETIINGPVTIGSSVFINNRCEINGETIIEDDVTIGPGVKFLSKTHEIGSESFRAGNLHHLPIRVGRGVWIGGGAIILGNVTIGPGAVVGAGSVVNRDVPENSVVAGNPARVVRELGPGYGGGPPGHDISPDKIRWA